MYYLRKIAKLCSLTINLPHGFSSKHKLIAVYPTKIFHSFYKNLIITGTCV